MITNYLTDETANTAIAFGTMLSAIQDLKKIGDGVSDKIPSKYTYGDVLAGEYAIAALQLILQGESKSDNQLVNSFLRQIEPSVQKSKELYLQKVAKSEEDMKLEEIAAYRRDGFSYNEISKEIEIPRSTVRYRIDLIKKNHPEWLQKEGN